MEQIKLPDAPAHLTGSVRAWIEPIVIPTYLPCAPDKNPMFLENRVYQGSSGRVYPLPFTDRIEEEKKPHTWQAVHIENEFLRLMILPEIGGRIHIALDKTNNYDIIYRQNVIKPALVGLAGPWISGGIEFNWPQHHRPSTFMPADVQIEEHSGHSITVWLSEHEPMNRMRGMHGICLHSGSAFIELKARLYNRTPLTQTFLWWANVATRVHEHYQSFFPPDVYYVADHAKRAMSTFPLCNGKYYGVDYAARARDGVPADQIPRQFVPPGTYQPNDLSWYANIPVPTSYMCMGTREEFFGGYDHAAKAGIVHVANPHISPGKKQWTWGNHEFGYAWDRNLTDSDGPYIEIMAGVYTDNQPDFSFLHPYETRTFSQYWYPIQKIGPAHKANRYAAISLNFRDGRAHIGICVPLKRLGTQIILKHGETIIEQWSADLLPGQPFLRKIAAPSQDLTLLVKQVRWTIIEYTPPKEKKSEVPPAATEPMAPEKIKGNDELYITGLHLEQYRHATRSPVPYWKEALKRDPTDSRCNNAMGLFHLRRGEFNKAESHCRRAVESLTKRNPNPRDGEPYYNLGLALRWLGRDDEAYAAFYKATWNYGWQSAAFYAIAELDCRKHNWATAVEHLNRSLRVNADHSKALDLRMAALKKINNEVESVAISANCDTQTRLDIAFDLCSAGLYDEAISALPIEDPYPMVHYARGYFKQKKGDSAAEDLARAAACSPDYCFPSRLDEMVVLESAIAFNPRDARAPYYLGNFLYDRRRHEEAIKMWERSAKLDGTFSIVWRNLGIGYHNILQNGKKALRAYDKAVAANSEDARLWYERDQLRKRLGASPQSRLKQLQKRLDLVALRDDLSVELATLYNQTGNPDAALKLLTNRKFQPWEGGEGSALGEFVRAHLALGRQSLSRGDAAVALQHFQSAMLPPESIGEAKHLLANQSDIHYYLGSAYAALGDKASAKKHWTSAATFTGDFQEMSVKSFSEMTYFRALSLQKLGKTSQAKKLLKELFAYGKEHLRTPAKIDYFATSLPTMLIFEDDLQKRQTVTATFLMAQAKLALGKLKRARLLLKRVLKLDRNHARAADLLAE
jgi:tetratricopeptide (TPR) repeat protein